MPFTLAPLSIASDEQRSAIRGRLQSGAYFGPEAVLLRSGDGRTVRALVEADGSEYPTAWPVLPEHTETVLTLYVRRLPDDFVPVVVVGLGAVELNANLVDVSHYLAEPGFWAMQAALHCASEEIDDPAFDLLGIPPAQAERWYDDNVGTLHAAGAWPYIRIPLCDARYVELEMAGGNEPQDRIWIGHEDGPDRVLLGYHSGHASLPALRVVEVAWVAAQLPRSASPLLWLSAASGEPNEVPGELVRELVSHIPGIAQSKVATMAQVFAENLAMSGVRWSLSDTHGWVNNGGNSQRNPACRLSILTASDFAYIAHFFPWASWRGHCGITT